jgi:RimJ/RimL family protein N-acetyltransferase
MVAIMTLNDGVLILRPLQVDLASMVFDAVRESQHEVPLWLPEMDGLSPESMRNFMAAVPKLWQEGSAFHFGTFDSVSGACLGGCGLTQVNFRHRFCNLYYWVRTSATRQGVASRAARLLAKFGFEQLKMERIEIVVETENLPSLRAAEKTGALREGVLRNRLNNRGIQRDAVIYSLIPQDLSKP